MRSTNLSDLEGVIVHVNIEQIQAHPKYPRGQPLEEHTPLFLGTLIFLYLLFLKYPLRASMASVAGSLEALVDDALLEKVRRYFEHILL